MKERFNNHPHISLMQHIDDKLGMKETELMEGFDKGDLMSSMICGSNLIKCIATKEELKWMRELNEKEKLIQILQNTGLMSNASIDNNLTVIHLEETSENLKTSQQHTRITITRKRKHQRPDYFQVHQETKKYVIHVHLQLHT